MKYKLTGLLFFLFLANTFAQDFIPADTDTIYYPDSTKIIVPDSLTADSTALFKPLADSVAADTITLIYQDPFSPNSSFISHDEMLRTDYEYPGDFLTLFPFPFTHDPSYYGQPEYVTYSWVYPELNGFYKDGVLLDNRLTGEYNLNLLQSESIDSIEIINLPRAFLYSSSVNLTAVNFIEKDFVSLIPYTRIKYYEGPYGQAMFDGIFNTMVFSRLNFFLDVTNRKAERSYVNTDYGSWQATAKLKYIVSNELNITGSYNFVSTDLGLYAGVNIDSIALETASIEEALYDEIGAYVNSSTGRQEALQHNFKLGALWKPYKGWKTNLKIYSLFDQDKRINYYSDSTTYKNKNTTYGVNVEQFYNNELFVIKLNMVYEKNDLSYTFNDASFSLTNQKDNEFIISPVVSVYFLDSLIIPSFYYKYSANDFYSNSSNTSSGAGLDLKINLDALNFYGGYSIFEDDYSPEMNNSIELGINYNSDTFFGSLRYFSTSYFDYGRPDFENPEIMFTGVGLSLNLLINKILFESYSYYFFDKNISSAVSYLPDYKINSGIYYKDMLFTNNLDLKTGFTLSLADVPKNQGFSSDYNFLFHDFNYRLDFTLSGVIREAATIYFTWENLTNNNYFVVPFFPMPERNIRFGIAWELFN